MANLLSDIIFRALSIVNLNKLVAGHIHMVNPPFPQLKIIDVSLSIFKSIFVGAVSGKLGSSCLLIFGLI